MNWWREFGKPPRIMGLDVARALAVLGMVGAHIGAAPDFDFARPETWIGIVHGRSSILFAVLAGVSIALMAGRTEIPERDRMPGIRLNLLGRGAAIFLIGIVLELLNTPVAVILTVYGLLYVAAIPFLRWRPAHLFLGAGVLAIAGPPFLALLQAATLGSGGPGVELLVFGTYPITVWMAFVLAGMALGRLPLDRMRTAVWMLVAGAVISVIGYGIGVVVSAEAQNPGSSSISNDDESGSGITGVYQITPGEVDFGGLLCDEYSDNTVYCYPESSAVGGSVMDAPPEEESDAFPMGGWDDYVNNLDSQMPWDAMLAQVFAVEPHSGGIAEVLGSGGLAVAVIALCLLLSAPLRVVLLPLAALGSMPLTAYAGHLLAFVAIAGPFTPLGSNEMWGVFSLVLIVAATLWAMFLGRGPLERLVGRAAAAMASGTKADSLS